MRVERGARLKKIRWIKKKTTTTTTNKQDTKERISLVKGKVKFRTVM